MAKFTADPLSSLTANETSSVNTINENFERIEEALEKTLSRDGTYPNTMNDILDMNSQRILHLPAAVNPTEPVRKAEFDAAIFGNNTSDFTVIYKDMLDALVTANPIESQFGGAGDGVTDDTAAVQAAVNFVVAAGGGTVLLTHPHLITAPITNTINAPIVIKGNHVDVGKLIVRFTAAAYPTGAAAIDFSYDESYNNNSVWIDNIGIDLDEASGNKLNTAIKIHYAARLRPDGAVVITNCRIDRGAIYWLNGIDLDTAPQSRIMDNYIYAAGGPFSTTKEGYGILLGQYSQGTMVHRNSIRGMSAAIYCSSDSVEDPAEFQAEGVSIRWNKAQNCDWGVKVNLDENEIAWSFTDNDFDTANGFSIRNLLNCYFAGNSTGWHDVTSDHVDYLFEYDRGTPGEYTYRSILGQINGGYGLRRGNIDFDVTAVSLGATTTITWSDTDSARNILGIELTTDNNLKVTVSNIVRFRDRRRIKFEDIVGMTELNYDALEDNYYRIGDLDEVGKTFIVYTDEKLGIPIDGSTYTPWVSGGTVALVYSTGTLADGDKVWIDRARGCTQVNDSPYILQDVDNTLKTARLTSYYDGSDIDSTSWDALTRAGNLTRYGRCIEVRGGRYLRASGLQVFERNVGIHLWPETKEIVWNNPLLVPTGPNQALSMLNDSAYSETIVTDSVGPVFIESFGAVGNGSTDDTVAFEAAAATGSEVYLSSGKTYLCSRQIELSSGTRIIGDGSQTVVMNLISFTNTDRNSYGGSTGALFLGNEVTGVCLKNFRIVPSVQHNGRIRIPISEITKAPGENIFVKFNSASASTKVFADGQKVTLYNMSGADEIDGDTLAGAANACEFTVTGYDSDDGSFYLSGTTAVSLTPYVSGGYIEPLRFLSPVCFKSSSDIQCIDVDISGFTVGIAMAFNSCSDFYVKPKIHDWFSNYCFPDANTAQATGVGIDYNRVSGANSYNWTVEGGFIRNLEKGECGSYSQDVPTSRRPQTDGINPQSNDSPLITGSGYYGRISGVQIDRVDEGIDTFTSQVIIESNTITNCTGFPIKVIYGSHDLIISDNILGPSERANVVVYASLETVTDVDSSNIRLSNNIFKGLSSTLYSSAAGCLQLTGGVGSTYKGWQVVSQGNAFTPGASAPYVIDMQTGIPTCRFVSRGDDYLAEGSTGYIQRPLVRRLGIAAISLANPCQITVLLNSDPSINTWYSGVGTVIYIEGILGTTEIPDGYYKLGSALAGGVFTLADMDGVNIDSSAYSAYTGGGSVKVGSDISIESPINKTLVKAALLAPYTIAAATLSGTFPFKAALFDKRKELDAANDGVRVQLPGYYRVEAMARTTGATPSGTTEETRFHINVTGTGNTITTYHLPRDLESYTYRSSGIIWCDEGDLITVVIGFTANPSGVTFSAEHTLTFLTVEML